MSKEDEKPKKKKGLDFTIGPEDSALIVRTDGHIELVSRELNDNCLLYTSPSPRD